MLKALLEEAKLKKVKPHKMEEVSTPSKEYFPSFHLDGEVLPEIKDWDVDEDYYIVMKVTQRSKSMDTVDGKEKYHASFDIKEIATLDDVEDEPKDDKQSKKDKLKKLYE